MPPRAKRKLHPLVGTVFSQPGWHDIQGSPSSLFPIRHQFPACPSSRLPCLPPLPSVCPPARSPRSTSSIHYFRVPTLRVSFVLPLRAKRKLHPLVGTFDFQPGSHPVSTLRFHVFSGLRLPSEPGSLFLPAARWTRLAVSLSAGRIPGHPSRSGYCQSQR